MEALRTLKDLESSTSYLSSSYGKFAQNSMAWGGDGGAGDFICHADRDVSRYVVSLNLLVVALITCKRPSHMVLLQ